MKVNTFFTKTQRIPEDAIFALTAQYNLDNSSRKVNLGQGTYRDGNAQPWVLPCVAEARMRIAQKSLNHEYLSILGLAEFRNAACKLVLGPSMHSNISNRIASCQALSGTGALHLAGALLRAAGSIKRQIWIPEPTWANHRSVFESLGFEVCSFKYYNHDDKCLDMNSYRSMLRTIPPQSIVVLHACAHNPSGCDPSQEQWKEIGSIMKERDLFPIFDAAYLGFNSGSVDDDAFPVRYFLGDLGLEGAVAVSFAKSMGLYGERVGCVFFVARDSEIAADVTSMMQHLQRSEISNPPAYGAKVAAAILNDPELTKQWYEDLRTMCGRIREMRKALYDELRLKNAPGDWKHVVQQSGMFSFLGLTPQVVVKLREKHHIYMSANSRISIAGLNWSNVAYVAEAISDTLRAEVDKNHKGQVEAQL